MQPWNESGSDPYSLSSNRQICRECHRRQEFELFMSTIAPSRFVAPVLAGPIPPPAPLPFIQYVKTIRRNFIAAIHEDVYRQGIVETKFIGLRIFTVNDPAGIRRVLLENAANYPKAKIERRILGPGLGNGLITSEGETWRAHRRIMSPFFEPRAVERYAGVMTDAAEKLAGQWSSLRNGTTVDLSSTMMQLTLDIISRSMFSSDSDGIVDLQRESSERYQQAMMFGLLDLVPGAGAVWGLYKSRRGKAILRAFDEAIHKLIAVRSADKSASARNDLLDGLIRSRDQETGSAMSAADVRDQVFTIFVAGNETTALALMWTWYLLALHPEQEEMLHAELKSVLNGRAPTPADIPNLPYTRMVFQESMRLYPPVHSLAWREARQADEICGRRVPRGSIVSIVPWVLHRHHAFWKNPNCFDPERFSPAESAGRERLAYLPFGFGPRICIGASFAMTEAVLILATLAQRFRLRLATGHHVEPQALFTLRAKYGMWMTLKARGNR
jgi:cytochrome P450